MPRPAREYHTSLSFVLIETNEERAKDLVITFCMVLRCFLSMERNEKTAGVHICHF